MLLLSRIREVETRLNAGETSMRNLDEKAATDLFDGYFERKRLGKEEEALKENILKVCSRPALATWIAGSNMKRVGLNIVLENLEGNVANLRRPQHMSDERKQTYWCNEALNRLLTKIIKRDINAFPIQNKVVDVEHGFRGVLMYECRKC